MKMNILIVDDVQANLYSLESLLKEIDLNDSSDLDELTIFQAISGEDALKLAIQEEVDLIVLDIQMPMMDGFEVAKFLKMNPKTKEIPVIFLTAAFKSEEFIKQGFKVGAVDYFTKPIEKFSFLNRVNLYIKMFSDNKKLKVQTEKANRLSNTKSEFLANMSHEIRTPLNAILGFIHLIKERTSEKEILDYASIIDESSKSLLQIIEDILDFSKLDSGKLAIEMIDFNTKNEFEIITHLFKAKCDEKEITLLIDLEDSLPIALNNDSLRIKQVISNLLSNAIKFSERLTKIRVRFSYEDGMLNVSVEDEGKGIAADKLSKIFESFSQEDDSTTREFGGTGLGLSISRDLVSLMGGELLVKSTLGEGSTFYFSIPAKSVEEVQQDKVSALNVSYENKRVLVAEDNKSNQLFIGIILDELGLKYEMKNDGLEAVSAFKTGKYDLILMDENMPNMSGIEATKEILLHEREKELDHTPIVALTANAIKGDRKKFLDAGMDEYMSKPIDVEKLKKMLNTFL